MFKEMLSLVLKSKIGKIGVALLLVLAGTSIWVTATYPSNFGKGVWGNPVYWADNPKLAPPATPSWLSWIPGMQNSKSRHQVITKTSTPPETADNGSEKTLNYRFRVNLSKKADPTFLSFSISDVRFFKDPPIVEVSLERGNQSVFLYRYFVSSRQAGEPIPATRFTDEPLYTLLTSDPTAHDYAESFFQNLRQNHEYSFDAIATFHLSDKRDSVGKVKFVAGGESYGILGTDNIGRNLWQGLLFGLPLSLMIGLSVALCSTLIGAVLAGVGGYAGGLTDTLIQRLIDLLTQIPVLPILIFLIFTFGSSLNYVIMFLILFGWMGLTIQLRPWIMQIRESGFIALAQARGMPARRIIFRHLLPQTLPFLFANFVLTIPIAILAEAGLSFLGLGDPSLPTWGYMLQQGYQTGALNNGYWWWVLPPGIAVVITSMTFFFIYYPLEAYVEPRLKKD